MVFKNLILRHDKRTESTRLAWLGLAWLGLAWLDNYLHRFHFVKSFRAFLKILGAFLGSALSYFTHPHFRGGYIALAHYSISENEMHE